MTQKGADRDLVLCIRKKREENADRRKIQRYSGMPCPYDCLHTLFLNKYSWAIEISNPGEQGDSDQEQL